MPVFSESFVPNRNRFTSASVSSSEPNAIGTSRRPSLAPVHSVHSASSRTVPEGCTCPIVESYALYLFCTFCSYTLSPRRASLHRGHCAMQRWNSFTTLVERLQHPVLLQPLSAALRTRTLLLHPSRSASEPTFLAFLIAGHAIRNLQNAHKTRQNNDSNRGYSGTRWPRQLFLAARRKIAYCRTVSTGHPACATTLCAVGRSRCVAAPIRPAASRTPRTITSAPRSFAVSTIRSAGSP